MTGETYVVRCASASLRQVKLTVYDPRPAVPKRSATISEKPREKVTSKAPKKASKKAPKKVVTKAAVQPKQRPVSPPTERSRGPTREGRAAKSKVRDAEKRAPLTRASIEEVALRLADREGLEALTMRRLAQALGVEAMSLYHHVAGKDALLDALVERVVEELFLPSAEGDWRSEMRRRALTAHAVLMAHPWATMLFVARLNVGPHMLRYVDGTLGCLRAAGFSWAHADHVWSALDAFTYGFTLQRLNFPLAPEAYASSAEGFLPSLPPETHPHLRGLAVEVIAGRHDGIQHLEFGLDVLLEGFEALRAQGLPQGQS